MKRTERIVLDETGDESQKGSDMTTVCCRVFVGRWEPTPGDVSTDLLEPMLIIPQLPDVEPTPTKAYSSDNRGSCNVYIRKMDLEKFGYTAGCPACEVHRTALPMSGQGHTAECRKRLEDAMTTHTSTATRVKATRVRQAERIIKDLDNSGKANPSSSSGCGQHKHVRLSDQEHVDSKPEGDTEMQTRGQEASVARKRPAETDVERLEEGSAETAETDPGKRIALKRQAEGDPSDSEKEDSAINSLAEFWHRKDDPDGEVDLLIFQQPDR